MSPEVPVIILAIATPIYFICLWAMNRLNIGPIKRRKVLALISAAVFSPILYVGLVMIWVMSISYYPENDFDQAKWNANAGERYTMSKDIIESKMLIGKTHLEVIQILGDNFSTNIETSITYELGFVPGFFNIDPDYLEITFSNGIVVEVHQYEG